MSVWHANYSGVLVGHYLECVGYFGSKNDVERLTWDENERIMNLKVNFMENVLQKKRG